MFRIEAGGLEGGLEGGVVALLCIQCGGVEAGLDVNLDGGFEIMFRVSLDLRIEFGGLEGEGGFE